VDQAANIALVAEDMVRLHGRHAYSYLCEQAQFAKQAGDIESAITWLDIALAALEILNEQGRESVAR
jgi:hypothetical protein